MIDWVIILGGIIFLTWRFIRWTERQSELFETREHEMRHAAMREIVREYKQTTASRKTFDS